MMNTTLPKLYYAPGACSLAPHILLEEIGEPYDLEKVALQEGQHLTVEYRKIHPLQRVPALQISGKILTETPAILVHLADLYPAMKLVPEVGSWQRAQAYEWCAFLASTVHPAFAQVFKPARYSDDLATHESIKHSGRNNIQRFFARIEERLAGQLYALGDVYSICDLYLLVFCRWGYRIQLEMQKYPAFCKLAERLLQRKAVERVFAHEGISLK